VSGKEDLGQKRKVWVRGRRFGSEEEGLGQGRKFWIRGVRFGSGKKDLDRGPLNQQKSPVISHRAAVSCGPNDGAGAREAGPPASPCPRVPMSPCPCQGWAQAISHGRPCPPGALLLVDVDDVLHQQVPLQPIDTVTVQQHLVTTRRAPEPAPRNHAAPALPVRVGSLGGGDARRGIHEHPHSTGIIPTAPGSSPRRRDHPHGTEIIPTAPGSSPQHWDHPHGAEIIPTAPRSSPWHQDHPHSTGIMPVTSS